MTMTARHWWRLYAAGIGRNFRSHVRLYCNRNVLKLYDRGMFQDIFPESSALAMTDKFNASSQTVYAGFDPTADSLHIGNLLVLMNLLHWQRSGHQVIALVGGATARIGDPSHRSSERIEMDQLSVENNIKSIKNNIETIVENHEAYFWSKPSKLKPVKILNNMDWYLNLNAVQFMSMVGRHFRLGHLLGKSSVQSRLNSDGGMAYSEFSYQLFQAYDWLHLLEKYDCRFQVGGNDQMGNIVAGHELIGRTAKKSVYGLTLPLILTESGEKFGKSAGNAVWLSSTKSSSFQLYQFFVRTKDSDVEKLLRLFTFLSLGQITDIVAAHTKAPEQREAQKILADHVTRLVHGDDGLKAAHRTTATLYDKSINSLSSLSDNEMMEVFAGASLIEILPEPGLTVLDLSLKAKCFPDEVNAIRIITAGGLYINHQRTKNFQEIISPGIHILPNKLTLLRVGKKTYHIVRWLS